MDMRRKLSSFEHVETSETENYENITIKRRKEELNTYQNFYSSEKEKFRNIKKIRFLGARLEESRSPTQFVILLCNTLFNTELTSDDIAECVRVPSWTDPNTIDLLITFKKEDRRNHVYNKRTRENGGFIKICDELGEERVAIWRKLVPKYGPERVYSLFGEVILELYGMKYRFRIDREFKEFEGLTTKPRSSEYDEMSEEEDDGNNMRQIHKELNEYEKLFSLENAKLRNPTKIRLLGATLDVNKSPTTFVILFYNTIFNTELTYEDIVKCVRVPSWTDLMATDILITFINEDRRNHVYNKRTRKNGGYLKICDELIEETVVIWKKLVKKYGLEKVYTKFEMVVLNLGGKRYTFLTERELEIFENFMMERKSELV